MSARIRLIMVLSFLTRPVTKDKDENGNAHHGMYYKVPRKDLIN